MFKSFMVVVLSLVILGCQSNNSSQNKSQMVESTERGIVNYNGFGSKFVLNEKVSVTAGHIKDEAKESIKVLKQHPTCDVALIQSNNKGKDPVDFDVSKLNDDVFAYGHPNGGKKEKEIKGKIIEYKEVSLQEYTKKCNVAVLNFKVSKGMSGGPVYNKEGKVVGVIFATHKKADISYMVPYESFKDLL